MSEHSFQMKDKWEKQLDYYEHEVESLHKYVYELRDRQRMLEKYIFSCVATMGQANMDIPDPPQEIKDLLKQTFINALTRDM